MKVIQLILSAMFLLPLCLSAQEIVVEKSHDISFEPQGVMSSDYFYSDFALDAEGNKVVVGSFSGENIAFDASTQITSKDSKNIFIAKYDDTNSVVWSKNIGAAKSYGASEAHDEAVSVVTDRDNNIYVLTNVSRSMDETVDFDSENSSANSVLEPGTDIEITIAKYTPEGRLQWMRIISDEFTDRALKLVLDHENNVWVTGVIGGFTGNEIDFDKEKTHPNDEDLLQGQFRHLGFIACYDSDGEFKSVKGIGEGLFSELNVAIGLTGNVYAAGSFNGNDVKLFLEDIEPELITSQGFHEFAPQNQDIFLVKYSKSGKVEWVKTISTPSFNQASDIAVDEDENVYVSGWFKGSDVDFDTKNDFEYDTKSSGSYAAAFVARYNTFGDLDWINVVNAQSNSRSLDLFDDYLIVGGNYFGDDVQFGDITSSSNSTSDGFISLFNLDGTWVDMEFFPSSSYTSIINAEIASSGNIHFQGFNGSWVGDGIQTDRVFFGETSKIITVLSTDPASESHGFTVSPNPTKGVFKIHLDKTEKVASVELRTLTGQLLLSISNTDIKDIDISAYPKGVYILSITTEAGIQELLKVIKP